jgi:sugar phosphate isomerase/epimerase
MLKDETVYLHIKDARVSDHQAVPSGQGDGKIAEILSELDKAGFEGFLSIEPHLGNFVGFSGLERNTPGFDLPDGGPKKFAIAVNALKKVLAGL